MKKKEDMKILLLNPPGMNFSVFPPLGIAILKSYCTSIFPDLEIKLIDLNEIYNNVILENLNISYENSTNKKNNENFENVVNAYRTIKEKREDTTFWNENKDKVISLPQKIFTYIKAYTAKYRLEDFVPQSEILNLAQVVLKENPSFLGFSIFTSSQYPFAMALAKYLKQQIDIPIVIGGASVEYIRRNQKKKYQELGLYDNLILGEGEIPFVEIIRLLKLRGTKNKHSKRTNEIDNSEIIYNLDDLPFPDYSDVNFSDYLNPNIAIAIWGSRGCAWGRCAYCTLYKCSSHRVRNTKNIVDEISHHNYLYGINTFYFVDAFLPPQRLRALSEEIIRRNIDIRFSFFARPIKAYSFELLNLAYKAGARRVRWGVESGSQHVIDLMEKGTRVEHFEEVLKWSYEAGLHNTVYILIGFPGETDDDFQQTIRWVEKAYDYIHLGKPSLFTLMKGSGVYNNPQKYGIRKLPTVLFK
ncbi:MAG: B12-binding domain-containing radical SAM protein, partial [Candidatus Hodarchaeota archaeon]